MTAESDRARRTARLATDTARKAAMAAQRQAARKK